MRYWLDLGVFAAVFFFGATVFESSLYGLFAGLIVATGAELVQGDRSKR